LYDIPRAERTRRIREALIFMDLAISATSWSKPIPAA
jgi:hypothetical protein